MYATYDFDDDEVLLWEFRKDYQYYSQCANDDSLEIPNQVSLYSFSIIAHTSSGLRRDVINYGMPITEVITEGFTVQPSGSVKEDVITIGEASDLYIL